MPTRRIHSLLHALGISTAIVGGCADRDITSGSSGGGTDGSDTDDSDSSTSGSSASGTATSAETTGPSTSDSSSTTSTTTGNNTDPKFDIGGLDDIHGDPCPLPDWATGCTPVPEPGEVALADCVPMDASCTVCAIECFDRIENLCGDCVDVTVDPIELPCGFMEIEGDCCTSVVVNQDASVCVCLAPGGLLTPSADPAPEVARRVGAPTRDEILDRLARGGVLPADVRARLTRD